MAPVTYKPIPIAYLLRPHFGGEGCLRDYSDRISREFLRDPEFHERYADLTEEERVRRAQDGAQNLLIAEIQMHGMDYTYDRSNDRGVLIVKIPQITKARERTDNPTTENNKIAEARTRIDDLATQNEKINEARTRIDDLATRVEELCGKRLRYQFA